MNHMNTYDIDKIRADFPILSRKINEQPLIYLDNAASTQKPQAVIDAIVHYYTRRYSNIHRGVHTLSQMGTVMYEQTRRKIQSFLNAKHEHEIIFTKGTTDGINLVAYSFGRKFLKEGDEILVTEMEHHSNIVPWQIVAQQQGAKVIPIPLQEDGSINIQDVERLISSKTKIISVTYVSNTLGTINPIKEIIEIAKRHNVKILVDAAQAIQHIAIDVQALDIDLLTFSGHKIYGPTGTGVLYGKEDILNEMPPFQGGGDMIEQVKFTGTTYAELPFKFEAGTPNTAGLIGLGVAIEYVQNIGLENIEAHEKMLLDYATEAVKEIEDLVVIGTAKEKTSVLSFVINGLHSYDLGVILDNLGIAIRTGHHCTQPIMDRYNITGTCRASFALYNTTDEIDKLVAGIQRAIKMLK